MTLRSTHGATESLLRRMLKRATGREPRPGFDIARTVISSATGIRQDDMMFEIIRLALGPP